MAVKFEVLSTISFDEGTNPYETAGPCPACTYALPLLSVCAADYFQQGYFICRACGHAVNVWEAALNFSMSSRMLMPTSLGASRLDVTIEMTTHSYLEVDLKEHGIPENAKILSVLYNSVWKDVGSVSPLEVHGNVPVRKIKGTILRLFGMPLGEGAIPRTGQVKIIVTWVNADDSPAWPYLVSAFESSLVDESAPALVFAQSAIEISMMPVIEASLKKHVEVKIVREFIKGTLTADHALNIVLPYICGQSQVPKMPDAIQAALNRLRSRRNKIIHSKRAFRKYHAGRVDVWPDCGGIWFRIHAIRWPKASPVTQVGIEPSSRSASLGHSIPRCSHRNKKGRTRS